MENKLALLRKHDPEAANFLAIIVGLDSKPGMTPGSLPGIDGLKYANEKLREHELPEYESYQEILDDAHQAEEAVQSYQASERHFQWIICLALLIVWAVGYWFTLDPIWPITVPFSFFG